MYCSAKMLATMWKDLDFKRRKVAWKDLFLAPFCETELESYDSQSMGKFAISRECAPRNQEYKLHWTYQDIANQSWVILHQQCKWRTDAVPLVARWTILRITEADPHPEFGVRCFIRLLMKNEPFELTDNILEQLTLCERFCQNKEAWDATYSEEAMRARDLEIRGIAL
jgi:hypothetical protein